MADQLEQEQLQLEAEGVPEVPMGDPMGDPMGAPVGGEMPGGVPMEGEAPGFDLEALLG